MKNLLQRIVLTVLLSIFIFSGFKAQIVVMQYRSVPQENVADFIFRESTYWSQVANKAIKEGKLLKWELWQRIGGFELEEGSHNFVFVNVYADKYGLDNNIWNISEVFPKILLTDMETTTLGRTVHQLVLEKQAEAGIDEGRFARINYSKVSNMESFLKFETEVWQPFINNAIIDGNTSFISWNLSTVLTPTGSDMPFNAITVDHFDSYSEAVQPRWSDNLTLPDMTSSFANRERIMAQIYGLVVSVP